MTVSLLLSARGCVLGVWRDKEAAHAKAQEYNADPDEDAPYSVQTWNVRNDEETNDER